jgi:hypothetical protein
MAVRRGGGVALACSTKSLFSVTVTLTCLLSRLACMKLQPPRCMVSYCLCSTPPHKTRTGCMTWCRIQKLHKLYGVSLHVLAPATQDWYAHASGASKPAYCSQSCDTMGPDGKLDLSCITCDDVPLVSSMNVMWQVGMT